MALRCMWNLNTSRSSASAPPHRSRSGSLLRMPSPWPGARRDCLGLHPRRSPTPSTVSTTGNIIVPLYSHSGVRPLRSSAVSSHGGGGSGRGGGGRGDEPGDGDREDDASSKEVHVCPLLKRKHEDVIPTDLIASTLEIFNVLTGNAAAAAVLASLKNNPTIRFLLRLVAPFSEGTVLRGVVLMLMDKRSDDPSSSDSSSTTSTEVNNPVGGESSYSSDDNDIDETASARHNAYLLQMVPMNVSHSETIIDVDDQNDTTNQHPSTAPLLNTTSDVNKKGFLGFIYTLVWALFTLYSALVTFSVTYPTSAKALVSFDDAWTKGICVINLMPCFGSVVMLSFASRFKDGESTDDHDGFGIFIWALYVLLLALIPQYFLTVHVYLHIPKWIVWFLGTVIFSLTVLPVVRYIEVQRPTVVATICAKFWKNLKCYCCRRSNTLRPIRATGLDKANSYAVEGFALPT